MLGGVCAGIARSAGLDPLLLRIALVAVTVLTGGAGVPAYLVAWVLIPREPVDATTASVGGPDERAGAQPTLDVRAAWTSAGKDLRSLTTELRRPAAGASEATAPAGGSAAADTTADTTADASASDAPGAAAPGTDAPGSDAPGTDAPASDVPDDAPPGTIPAPRSPLAAADDAATALGDRLRTPEVQAEARKAAASVTEAVNASVDELARRVRRDRS